MVPLMKYNRYGGDRVERSKQQPSRRRTVNWRRFRRPQHWIWQRPLFCSFLDTHVRTLCMLAKSWGNQEGPARQWHQPRRVDWPRKIWRYIQCSADILHSCGKAVWQYIPFAINGKFIQRTFTEYSTYIQPFIVIAMGTDTILEQN